VLRWFSARIVSSISLDGVKVFWLIILFIES